MKVKIEANLSNKIDTVVALAEYWKDSMPKKPGQREEDGQYRDWEGLSTLLDDFSKFAKDYKAVLSKAPVNQCFIMNDGAERLLHNFDILSRASEQRRGALTKDSLAYRLAQAEDKLAEYCSQWRPSKNFHSSYLTLKTPVAYFEKAYGISRALYRPEIPVISIPLTEYRDSDQWFALAHELGHSVFWNSLDSLESVEKLHNDMYNAIIESLQQSGRKVLELWGPWMEEIFADVVGVLLAGPAYVISTQDIAAEKIRRIEDFSSKDLEHPCSYLRPWAAYAALCEIQELSNINQALLGKVEQRWQDYCQDADPVTCDCGQDQEVALEALQKDIKSVVQVILQHPIWPNKQKLVDLINYAKWEINPDEINSLPSFSAGASQPVTRFLEKDIPPAIKEFWQVIKKRLPEQESLTDEEKARQYWEMLVNLGLEDQHEHWGNGEEHTDLRRHWLLGRWHRHERNTHKIFFG